MAFKLIMVDPRPATRIEGSATSQRRSHNNKSARENAEQSDLPVMIHCFDSGATGKAISRSKTAIGKRKTMKVGKGRGSSERHELVFCPSPFASAKPATPIERDVHSGHIRKPTKEKINNGVPQSNLTFVSSITDDYQLEYANPWQSSFEFDGRKPQRPLFRITSPKLRKNVTKPNSHMTPSNIIDPSFAFSHNSLNVPNDKSTKHQQIDFDTNPIFKIPLNNR
ncbi:LAFA_0B02278g1_1 [Lachancea sp. 'fantastica']|nr:LAFA_0B02278g1_1 [Lachancea sp. 'fantastica']